MGRFRVAVVGGRPAPIWDAKELGVDVVLVHEEGGYEQDTAALCEQVLHAPITDGPAVLAALRPLHAERPFDRVLTTTEFAGESTGYVVDALGLEGVREDTARALKDKAETRRRLATSGVSPVAFASVDGLAAAEDFLQHLGRPIVLKPADGVASLHIHRVERAEDVETAWRALEAAGITNVIAEEYLDGPVVSVDSFSFGGRHVPIGYSEYRMNDRYVEWEVSTPSRVALPQLAELRELTPKLLDAVGLTEGPSHSEFVLTDDGPRVLESHARLAGSGAPELVRRAFGYDLNRMFLTVPLGIDELPAGPPDPIAGAAVRFFTPSPGVVVSVDVPPGAADDIRVVEKGAEPKSFMPYLYEVRNADVAIVLTKHPGERVPPLLTVADCVSGYVIATGADAADAVAKCERVDEVVTIETG